MAVSARSCVECFWDQAVLGEVDDTGLVCGLAKNGLCCPGKPEQTVCVISGNSSLTCVSCNVLVNLGLLIGNSSGFTWVGCDILVNLRATDGCVVVAKSTMYLPIYPQLSCGSWCP